jgi:hypothetical protein
MSIGSQTTVAMASLTLLFGISNYSKMWQFKIGLVYLLPFLIRMSFQV